MNKMLSVQLTYVSFGKIANFHVNVSLIRKYEEQRVLFPKVLCGYNNVLAEFVYCQCLEVIDLFILFLIRK